MNETAATREARALWKPRAEVYNNEDFFSVEAYSGYVLALPDPADTESLLSPDVSDTELGEAVLNALKQSRFLSYKESTELRLNAKLNYNNWVTKLMTLYGYKTKRALFKAMKSCGIECQENIITIRPSHHEKLEAWDGEGFTEEDYVKIPADAPPTEIGAALRLAFSRCTC